MEQSHCSRDITIQYSHELPQKIFVSNFEEVVEQLRHPDIYVASFLVMKLGGKFTLEDSDRKRLVLEGISLKRLQDRSLDNLILEYRDKFVFCSTCVVNSKNFRISTSDELIVECKKCQKQDFVLPQPQEVKFMTTIKEHLALRPPVGRRRECDALAIQSGGHRKRSKICRPSVSASTSQRTITEEDDELSDENVPPQSSPDGNEFGSPDEEGFFSHQPDIQPCRPSRGNVRADQVGGEVAGSSVAPEVDRNFMTNTPRRSDRLRVASSATAVASNEQLGKSSSSKKRRRKKASAKVKHTHNEDEGNFVTHEELQEELIKFKEEFKKEFREELMTEFREQLMPEFKAELMTEFREQLMPEFKTELMTEFKQVFRDELLPDIKQIIRTEVGGNDTP